MHSSFSPLSLTFGGYFLLVIGVFVTGLSIPLIVRAVGMNEFYGVRTEEALKSDENWYAINYYGGKQLLGMGIFMIMWSIFNILLIPIGFVTHKLTAGMSAVVPILIGFWIVAIRINDYNNKF